MTKPFHARRHGGCTKVSSRSVAARGPSVGSRLSVSVVPLDSRELPGVRSVSGELPSRRTRRVAHPSDSRINLRIKLCPHVIWLDAFGIGRRRVVPPGPLAFAVLCREAACGGGSCPVSQSPRRRLDPTTPEVRMAIDGGVNICGLISTTSRLKVRHRRLRDDPRRGALRQPGDQNAAASRARSQINKSSYGKGTSISFYEAAPT